MGRHRGFTLLEMMIVVAILVAVAGIVVPLLTGVQDYGAQTATQSTLLTIRESILGKSGGIAGYLNDVGQMPGSLGDLYVCPTNLPSQLQQYDPVTRRGWHGPYLLGTSPPKDAWNHQIVLVDPAAADARLVSPGPNGVVDANQPGDDLILYLSTQNNGQP